MQIVHLLSVNHIVFPLCYKANNNKGLLSSSLWGGKWRRDAEWADREREVTAILIVNIIYFYWALGLWDLSIHALSENPIRWSLSVLLQWKHRAPSNLRLRLTCTHTKKTEERLEQEEMFWFLSCFLLPVLTSARREKIAKTLRTLHLQDVLKVLFYSKNKSVIIRVMSWPLPLLKHGDLHYHIVFIFLIITIKKHFQLKVHFIELLSKVTLS